MKWLMMVLGLCGVLCCSAGVTESLLFEKISHMVGVVAQSVERLAKAKAELDDAVTKAKAAVDEPSFSNIVTAAERAAELALNDSVTPDLCLVLDDIPAASAACAKLNKYRAEMVEALALLQALKFVAPETPPPVITDDVLEEEEPPAPAPVPPQP